MLLCGGVVFSVVGVVEGAFLLQLERVLGRLGVLREDIRPVGNFAITKVIMQLRRCGCDAQPAVFCRQFALRNSGTLHTQTTIVLCAIKKSTKAHPMPTTTTNYLFSPLSLLITGKSS